MAVLTLYSGQTISLNSYSLYHAALGSVLFGLIVFLLRSSKSRRHPYPLPPGPPRRPIVGNALQIPMEHTWLKLSEWANKYGDLVYLNVLGKPMLIINSAKTARELMDKKSSIFSDRPSLVMAELSGYTETFALLPYGDEWRRQRKHVAQHFNTGSNNVYYPIQEKNARKLIRNIIEKPEDLENLIKFHIGAIIMRATYGVEVKDRHDPYLTTPLQAMANFSRATAPAAFLVDSIPSLRHLPKWFPGTGFFKVADDYKKVVHKATWAPYEYAKERYLEGNALSPNVVQTELETRDEKALGDIDLPLGWACSSVMGGGLDTNMSATLSFFMAMVIYPEVQAKARAELDSVVGRDRLPTLSDMPHLPYMRAVVTESLRWYPPFPMGLPHSVTQDDVYNGYFIAKDTMILPNVWHMTHNPIDYPNPLAFNPDRYRSSDQDMLSTQDLIFGFGRRVCPGRLFANATMFAVMSTVLSTCEILPAKDEFGKDIIPVPEYTSGNITFPKAFKYALKPRSEQAKELLEQSLME